MEVNNTDTSIYTGRNHLDGVRATIYSFKKLINKLFNSDPDYNIYYFTKVINKKKYLILFSVMLEDFNLKSIQIQYKNKSLLLTDLIGEASSMFYFQEQNSKGNNVLLNIYYNIKIFSYEEIQDESLPLFELLNLDIEDISSENFIDTLKSSLIKDKRIFVKGKNEVISYLEELIIKGSS